MSRRTPYSALVVKNMRPVILPARSGCERGGPRATFATACEDRPMSTTQPYTNLVFEGGGVKGVAYAGALEVLDSAGILAQVTAVAGTSAGAITAALVALGQTPDELRETMLALDFGQFEDGGLEGPLRLVE